jgi:hypothetical protein
MDAVSDIADPLGQDEAYFAKVGAEIADLLLPVLELLHARSIHVIRAGPHLLIARTMNRLSAAATADPLCEARSNGE